MEKVWQTGEEGANKILQKKDIRDKEKKGGVS